jgi:hypothetical protein
MEEEYKITIPEYLKRDNFRFILLGRWDHFKKEAEGTKIKELKIIPGKKSKKELDELKDQGFVAQGKVPQEAAWQSSNNYRYDDPILLNHIARGYNYGIATGFGQLAILDDDTPDKQLSKLHNEKIGETSEVKTGSGGFHQYITVPGMNKKIIFYNKDGHHLGELQWKTQQCVGPNSIHPTGEPYVVHKDIPILEVPVEKINEVFKEFIPIKDKVIREHKIIDWNGERVQDIPVTNIVSTVGLHDMSNGNLQGSHPGHGSSTGMNFRITANNTWYCYRCRSGGGPAELIGVMEGIIPCHKAGAHCFTEDEGRRVIKIAREKYGLKTPEKNNIFEIIVVKNDVRKAKIEKDYKILQKEVDEEAELEEEEGDDGEGEVAGAKATPKPLSPDEEEQMAELKEEIAEDIVELFCDEDGITYGTISIKGHRENLRLLSSSFKNFVIKTIYDKSHRPPSKNQLDNILAIFSTQALFEGKRQEVFLRSAHVGDKIYIDIGDEDWKVLSISPSEIKVLKHSPVKFKRYRHMKEIKFDLDAKIKDIDLLWHFIPIADDDKILLRPHIALLLVPDIPYAILVVYGSQGSGKSFSLKLIRQLVDPSSLKLLSMAKDKTELYQQLGHHYLPIFDNVTSLSKDYSDLFCKVVTGEGFSKRQLYTDDEDIIYNYIRKLGFNGINLAGEEPDFLDRSIPINLARITRTARKTEAQILAEFEIYRPKIMGAILKIIQQTLPLIKDLTLEIKSLPRMADYAIWCEAASRGPLGEEPGKFLDAYYDKIEGVNRESLEASPVAATVMEFMRERREWEGTPSELLSYLNQDAEKLKINTHQQTWPAAPNILSRKINDVRANLEDEGFKIFIGKRNGDRTIMITKQKPLTYKEEEKQSAERKLAMEIAKIEKKEREKIENGN